MHQDVLDILLLRGKQIGEYRYPFWQIAALLTLIGFADAIATIAGDVPGFNPAEIVAMEWVFAGVATLFLRCWLQQGERWNGEGSLFSLLVLGSAAATVPSLLGTLSGSQVLQVLLNLYGIIIFVETLHRGTRVSRRYGFMGLMLLATVFFAFGAAAVKLFAQ